MTGDRKKDMTEGERETETDSETYRYRKVERDRVR